MTEIRGYTRPFFFLHSKFAMKEKKNEPQKHYKNPLSRLNSKGRISGTLISAYHSHPGKTYVHVPYADTSVTFLSS